MAYKSLGLFVLLGINLLLEGLSFGLHGCDARPHPRLVGQDGVLGDCKSETLITDFAALLLTHGVITARGAVDTAAR